VTEGPVDWMEQMQDK